jgi:hypothetical protein
MIIPQDDLKQLTRFVHNSAQAKWLRRNGWKFTVNKLGAPVVALAEFNRHMVGRKAAMTQELNLGING